MEDEPFLIKCQLSSFEALKWQKDGVNVIPSDVNLFKLTERTVPGGLESNLSVSRAQVRHSGPCG